MKITTFCKQHNITEDKFFGKEKINGYLYLGSKSQYIGKRTPSVTPQWGDSYIKADGIMTEIVSHHGNVYKVRKIAHKEIEYIITDGAGNWAHGETLAEAKEDLLFKITDRKKSDYEHLTASDTLSHADMIRCYRVVTGACSAGTKYFVKNLLGEKQKESYTIGEVAELTRDQYGNDSFRYFLRLNK